MPKTVKKLTDFEHDKRNANRGTKRGADALDGSLERLGAGRSIVVDKSGRVIAGNKTLEAFKRLGREDVVIVPSDGSKLVVVQRTDLDLEQDAKAKELAVADNRVGELSLEWDPAVLKELEREINLNVMGMFTGQELEMLLGDPVAVNDPNGEYVGMPEFENEDVSGVRQIIVHFRSQADAEDFARILGQKITDKTKSLWHPAAEIADEKSFAYVAKEG